MRRSNWLVIFCLLALMTAACSSSSTPLSSAAPDLAETEALIKEIILPAVQLIGLIDPFELFGQPLAANGGGEPCDIVDCFSGTIDVCVNGAVTTATFNACTTAEGIRFDNDIVITETTSNPFTGEADVNGFDITTGDTTLTLSGTADLALADDTASIDLNINVAPIFGVLEGGLDSSRDKGCLIQSTDDLTFGIFGLAAIGLDGVLTYCPGDDWPTGLRELTIVQIGNDLAYGADFSDSANFNAFVDVTDASDGKLLVECDVDLADDVDPATCNLPAEQE